MTQTQRDKILGQLASLEKAGSGPDFDMGQVTQVVESILKTASGDISAETLKLYHELESLASYIQKAKTEIASIQKGGVTAEDIQSATVQLDEVVASGEQATCQILEAAEKIGELCKGMSEENQQKVTEQVTQIYEACGFQDLSAQRIQKVVKTLKHIEEKISVLLVSFRDLIGQEQDMANLMGGSTATDEDLLNGPQLKDEAQSQEDIDALFDSL